jgi:O-antigen/teichoic acid export membrane protein
MSNFALNKYSKLRLTKNIKSETLQIVSSLFIQLIFPLAMINIFGVYNFGNFILFITILSMLDVFKMNINSFGIQKMSYFYNLKKKKNLKLVLRNCSSILLFNSILIIFIFLILISLIDYFVNIFDSFNEINSNLIFILILINFFLGTFIQIFTIGISYKGELYRHYNLTTYKVLSSRLLIIIIGFFINNFLVTFYIFTLINVIFFILYYYEFQKNFRFYNLLPTIRSISFFKTNIKKIFSFSNELTSKNIKNNLQLFFVGILFGSEALALISTAKTLFYFLPLRLATIFINNFNYEYLRLFVKKKIKEIRYIYIKQLIYIISFSIFIIVLGSFLGKDVYSYWLKEKIQITNFLIILILFDVSLTLVYEVGVIYFKSINNFFSLSLIRIIFEVLIIVIFLTLNSFYDLNYEALFVLNIINMLFFATLSLFMTLKKINK